MSNAIGWFEIYVSDMPRARKFYESAFQRTLAELKSPDPAIELWHFEGDMNNYGSAGALVKRQGMTPDNSGTIVYFACKDCAIEEKRAAQFGGSICKSKMSIGQYGFISLVNDTEGNMIGLHSM